MHEEPDDTAKPRRSSRCSSDSPSTYRQENVTMLRQPQSAGSPTTSTVRDEFAVPRSGCALDQCRSAVAASASRRWPARPRATRRRRLTIDGRSGTPGDSAGLALVLGDRASATGCRCARPGRRAVGPPHVRASPVEHGPAGRQRRVPDGLGRRRRSSGTPSEGARHGGHRLDRCRPRDWPPAGPPPRRRAFRPAATKASMSTRAIGVDAHGNRHAAGRRRASCSGVQHGRMLDRAVHEPEVARRLPATAPRIGRVQRLGRVRGEAHLVRTGPET